MKKLFLILSTVFICLGEVYSQAPPGGGMAGRQGGNAPAIGHVFGKIVDETGEAVSYATVIVLQNKLDSATKKMKDVLINGMSTEINGEFSIEDLPIMGTLKLQVSAIGYTPFEQEFSFERNTSGSVPVFEKDMGKILLTTSTQELNAVTVTGNKSSLILDVDKKIFNVDQNLISAGGTAVDVMKNVPSVAVDIDGNVTVRNSSPQILLDGRPTSLTLDQIPADAIESVEIMTNPSASYDASGGGAGILNIVLKKNKKTGYNGSIRLGTNQNGESSASGDFNLRMNKINFTGSINGRLNNGHTTGTTERTNLIDVPVTYIDQSNTDHQTGGMLSGRFGIDYLITNRTTLSLSAMKFRGDMKTNSLLKINTDSLYEPETIYAYSERSTDGERIFGNTGLIFGMKQTFPKEGEQLTIDANYFSGKNSNSSLYSTDYYSDGAGSSVLYTDYQQVEGSGNNKNIVIQTDYVNLFSKKLKLETGLRAALRSLTNTNDNYIFNDSTDAYLLLPSFASNYKNMDNVYAAYVSVTSSIKDFGYKLGLRAESSQYTGELSDTKETFSHTYPVSLFPSVFLTQKLTDNTDLQFTYTRRINRPGFMQLIPFIDSTDNLNITVGNPDLVPEFTHSFEMNYLNKFKANNTLLISVYYKYTNNLITKYIESQTDAVSGNEILINTYRNANSSYSAGSEITLQNNFTKWWDISTDLNIYNSKINTDNLGEVSQDALWSYFVKFNSNFKLPKNFTLQLTALYQSKTNLPINSGGGQYGGGGGGPFGMQAQSASQGYINAFYDVDFAVKKTFYNNKLSVSASINDIFKSRITDIYSESAYFIQDYTRLRDPQLVRLNITYNFGKIDAVLFNRKTQGTGQSGTDTY